MVCGILMMDGLPTHTNAVAPHRQVEGGNPCSYFSTNRPGLLSFDLLVEMHFGPAIVPWPTVGLLGKKTNDAAPIFISGDFKLGQPGNHQTCLLYRSNHRQALDSITRTYGYPDSGYCSQQMLLLTYPSYLISAS